MQRSWIREVIGEPLCALAKTIADQRLTYVDGPIHRVLRRRAKAAYGGGPEPKALVSRVPFPNKQHRSDIGQPNEDLRSQRCRRQVPILVLPPTVEEGQEG